MVTQIAAEPPTDPQDRLERSYRATPAVVALARHLIDRQAGLWRLPAAPRDAAVSSASELVTNAVAVSGATDLLKIRFQRLPGAVLLSVWDTSSVEPKSARPDLTLEEIDAVPDGDSTELPEFGGWGLPLVEALASETGAEWVLPAPQSGKWIWARFDL